MTAGVLGPAWADTAGRLEVVRNPLRIQNHVTSMVAALVPGVIATTTQARYYGLHPWLVAVASERELDVQGLWRLIRRVEVALAWVSSHHDDHLVELPTAHGEFEIRPHVHDGILNLASASEPGQYVAAEAGFAGSTYFGSEVELGLMERGWQRGPRYGDHTLQTIASRLAPLLELAENDELDGDMAKAAADAGLCVCGARAGNEGDWLRRLICGELGGPKWMKPDMSRRGTATLLARSIKHAEGDIADPIDAMRQALCFDGSLDGSPVAFGLVDQAEAWRGLLLRHYLVTAWRDLWADVVEECIGTATSVVQNAIASRFGNTTVKAFVDQFETSTAEGRLLPAEEAAWAELPSPVSHVAVMAIATRRLSELGDRAKQIFTGADEAEWGPGWLQAEFSAGSSYQLSAWVSNLVERMLNRSVGIALDKFRLVEGRGVVPAQVRERDGTWHQVTATGRGALNLRLQPLAYVMAGAGLLDQAQGSWTVTTFGRDHLTR
jgi:hypothetical protein